MMGFKSIATETTFILVHQLLQPGINYETLIILWKIAINLQPIHSGNFWNH